MTAAPQHLAHALRHSYSIERELGRGGMATVYLARDLRHDRLVALKVLHPELSAGVGPERFLREIRVAARLQHPHILPLFDSGSAKQNAVSPELLWYTMPYIDGESLRARLQREAQLPLEDAMQIGRELGEALEYAHAHGVIHRDIKPENVLLSQGHALLSDFGIARALEAGTQENLTGTGVAIGTPVYMSPEQAMGERNLDGRSDVYSLACVVFEMLAGEPPHTGPTPQAVLAKRLLDPPPEVSRCRPGTPAAVQSVLRRALATMQVDRFRSAGDFVAALKTAGLAPQVQPTRVRRRWLAPVLLAMGAGLAAVMLVWRAQRSQPVETEGPIRLAVLPFENPGDTAQTYLTDGIAEGVRGKLARLPGVQVISGSSSEEYRHTRKPMQQIGRELGVPYLLVGSVSWQGKPGDRALEIRPQLIQTASGSTHQLRPVQSPVEAVAEIQSQLAFGVTEALGVKLDAAERSDLSDRPTANPEAYAAYIRAGDYVRRVAHWEAPPQLLTAAIALFKKAMALDTGFVLTKVGLAEAYRVGGTIAGGDTAQYRQADSLLTKILESRPNLPEALAGLGDLRRVQEDLDAAARLYERAISLNPEDAVLLSKLSFLQSVRLDSSALRTGARAVSLGPRDSEVLRRVTAGTSIFRHFEELERYSDRMIELEPGDPFGYVHRALAQLLSRGDTAAAIRTLATAEQVLGHTPFLVAWVYALCGPAGWQRWHRLTLSQLGSADVEDTLQYYWYHAQIAGVEGRNALKRAYADSVVAVAATLRGQTRNYGFKLAIRSYGEATLDRHGKARRDLAEAETALRKMNPSAQAMYRVAFVTAYAELGDLDRALAASRLLLEEPTPYTRKILRLSPEFAALHRESRFQQLLADTTLP